MRLSSLLHFVFCAWFSWVSLILKIRTFSFVDLPLFFEYWVFRGRHHGVIKVLSCLSVGVEFTVLFGKVAW